LEEFFKSTIAGIILLGAVGSIAATLVIWGANKVIKLVAPKLYASVRKILHSLIIFSIAPGLKNQIRLYLDANPNKLDAYYSSQKIKVITLSTIQICLFVWLLARVKIDGIEISSFETVFYISLIFLLLGMIMRIHASIMVPLFFDIDVKVEEHINSLPESDREVIKKIRANKALQRTSR
jgi:hypothetical protein